MLNWLADWVIFLGIGIQVPGARIMLVKQLSEVLNPDGTVKVIIKIATRPEYKPVRDVAFGISISFFN
jgi:hypothetical protein